MNSTSKVLAALSTAAVGIISITGAHAQSQSSLPVYVINEITVNDPATFKSYAEKQSALFKSFGGRFLSRSDNVVGIAGSPPKRVAIYVFENMEKFKAWQSAPQQKELAALRDKSAEFHAFAVEGCAGCEGPTGR